MTYRDHGQRSEPHSTQFTVVRGTADLSKIDDALLELRRYLPADAQDRWYHEVHLGLHEAVVNILKHAYGLEGGEVRVSLDWDGSVLRIELRDSGLPWEPEAYVVPSLDPDEPREAGYGVGILRSAMDRALYARHDDVNVWTLIRRWNDGRRMEGL